MAGIEDLLTQAASATQQMVPDNTGGTGSLLSMQPTTTAPPPMPQFKPPDMQFGKAGNEFQTVGGRKRADRQALLHDVASLVKSGVDYHQQTKMYTLQNKIKTLLEAQQGLQEAKQSGDQEAIAHNTRIINTIWSDKKSLKDLTKAFSIDIFDTKGKNKLENQALIGAWKDFSKKQQAGDKSALNPMAQRFMQSQPIRLGMSPEVQAQAAAIKAGVIPHADKLLQVNAENYKTIVGAKTSEDRTAGLENAAKIRAAATDKASQARLDVANVQALGRLQAATIAYYARKYQADRVASTWDKRLQRIDEQIKIADKNATTNQNKLSQNAWVQQMKGKAQMLNNRLKTLASEDDKLITELGKKGTKWGIFSTDALGGKDRKQAQEKLMQNDVQRKLITDQLNNLEQQMNLVMPETIEQPQGSEQNPIEVDDTEDNDEE